jgi:hypothetical protein
LTPLVDRRLPLELLARHREPEWVTVETTGQKSAYQRRCVFSIIVWIIIIVVVLALLGFFARSRR